MRIHGKAFDGLTRPYDTHIALQRIAGGAYWFTQFTPTLTDCTRTLLDLLVLLYHMDLCCNISRSFAAYLAGLQNTYCLIVLYVAIENLRIINLLQKEEADPYDFTFGPFHFRLVNSSDTDTCTYEVTRGTFTFQVMVLGIDTSGFCDIMANVDFVHFLWENVNQYGYRRHSITMAPPIFPDGPLRLLFLRHHITAACGWEYTSRCVACRDLHRYIVRPLAGCVAPLEVSSCNVYRRQTPSLRDLALHTVHTIALDLPNVKLTREVTYRQYLFACGFIVAGDATSLLPPDFPHISVDCRFAYCEIHKLHRDCVVVFYGKTSRIRIDSEFRDAREAVLALINGEELYFCTRCEKPLFFVEACSSHAFPLRLSLSFEARHSKLFLPKYGASHLNFIFLKKSAKVTKFLPNYKVKLSGVLTEISFRNLR
jgi:hypothetical protein